MFTDVLFCSALDQVKTVKKVGKRLIIGKFSAEKLKHKYRVAAVRFSLCMQAGSLFF